MIAPRSPSDVRTRLVTTAALALLLVVVALPYRWVPSLDWTGVDAAPLVQSARFDREGALERIFMGEMRGDSRVASSFYRPITSLSYGVDHKLAGDDPAAYHRIDVLLHLLATLAVWWLVSGFTGTRSLAPWIAAFVFGIHPLQLETVPAIARRSEILATLFLILTAVGASRWGASRRHETVRRRWPWLALYLAACIVAPLSKELGFLAVTLGTLAYAVSAPTKPRRSFMRGALVVFGGGLLCAGSVAVLRTLALGGRGGYADFMDLGPRQFVAAALDLLDPWRLLEARGDLVVAAVLLALIVALLRGDDRLRRPLLLGMGFVIIPLGLFAIAGVLFPWYLYAPVAGTAIVLGSLAGSIPRLVGTRRVASGLAVSVVIVVLVVSASWREAPWEWRSVSDLTRLIRDQLEESAGDCTGEEPLYVAFLPHRVLHRPGEIGLQAASGGRDYSYSAMLALEGLEKEVRAVSYITVLGPAERIHTQVLDWEAGVLLGVEGPARLERPWNQDVEVGSDPQQGDWVAAHGFRYVLREGGLEVIWEDRIASDCVQLSFLN